MQLTDKSILDTYLLVEVLVIGAFFGAAFVALYLVAYRRAQRLAPPRAALAWMVLVGSAVAGVSVIVYTANRFAAIPDPVPTHFGITGQPDGWSTKSVGAVMVLPIMTLVMGVTLGGLALFIAKAKRRVRLDEGASLVAQNRFRAAVSRYVAIVGLLVTTMLASLSVTSVQVALGQRPALPGPILLLAPAIVLYAMFGGAWLAIRYGQGGSRLEDPKSEAPHTDP